MGLNIFMSYSRREVGFVDQLADHIEKQGHGLWLDYRSLVPGKPWEEQIALGITNADTVLLVVSKPSIASHNVEFEWKRVLQQKGKRVILLIFEAVDLPPELQKFEWVDFRGNYQNALKELDRQLQMKEAEEHPAPQTGFKVPAVVWLAFGLSLVTALMSLGALWTVFVPFLLLPLPFYIFKRSFSYLLVQAALLMLPFALYLTSLFSLTDSINEITFDLSIISIPFVLALMYLLRSSAMQRWGKPEALTSFYSSHWSENYPQPQPVSFYIDHAPQDGIIAAELTAALTADGHHLAHQPESANATFALISAFKEDSNLDCEKHVVFPVIVQSNQQVSPQLSKIQWMDFRPGVMNLNVVGRLVDQPEKLLRALCIRPMGNQLVLPRTILYLVYFIAFLAVVCIGSWFPYILQYLPDIQAYADLDGPVIELVLSLILFGAISYFMVRQIVARKGFFASFLGLIVGTAALGLIIYWQGLIDFNILDILGIEVDDRGFSSLYSYYLYWYGGVIMLIYLLIKRKDLRRWFPVK